MNAAIRINNIFIIFSLSNVGSVTKLGLKARTKIKVNFCMKEMAIKATTVLYFEGKKKAKKDVYVMNKVSH